MSLFAEHVEAAVLAKLATAGLSYEVLGVVPDKKLPPYTLVAESVMDDVGGKGLVIEQHQLTIRTLVAGTSKTPLLREQARITAALDRQPLSRAGVRLSAAEVRGGGNAREEGDGYLLAELQVVVRARPPL
ncbi:hypothetical protein GCM10007973_18420 [Polymorphobacter multimanifer]|uniref:DUF3168 domain-containing protein n=1 Tax=Polymorphobacter multimanifer TaxID=1070431 RepID=A0A841L6X3_9SPHN|nr:hypothetical protein [Polymorphobacter multimanifer]MBB6228357.1 hypothetical protein [Polymorphobacter multimanifer]GGI82277.1 hypothetical protein GCM10007973_18420 [Polymorphobacter multimanifer]